MSDYYYCTACGELFEKTEAEVQSFDPSPAGISLASGSYEVDTCPWCGSDELIDANTCVLCGDPIKPTKRLCKSCMDYMEPLMEIIDSYISRKNTTGESAPYVLDTAFTEKGL